MESTSNGNRSRDVEVDVLVIGSGAAGMVAALTARAEGLETLLIEKTELFGGSTARSGGGAWVPNAPVLLRAGQQDDPADILKYLDVLAGDRVTHERLARYVDESPKMMTFLEGQGRWLREGFFWISGYSDYHPERGGHPLGRGLWATPIDRRELGPDIDLLRKGQKRMQLPLGAWITSIDLHHLLAVRWGGLKHKRILLTLAWRVLRARLLGERIAASGQALASRLWLTLREKEIPVWLSTPMRSLLTDADGRVIGVAAERDGQPVRIVARRGVILATGGFDHDLELRKQYEPAVQEDWSLGSPENVGDGHRAGMALGAAVDLMEDAWWMPTMRMPDGTLAGLVAERQYPGQFVVNGAGERFVNESTPYVDFCHAQIAGEKTGVRHIPAWMVLDEHAWKRNIIAGHFPGTPLPRSWVSSGLAHTAPTIEELAQKIGVPPQALAATQRRFNGFARRGVDDDFHRGESSYDRYYGDPTYTNPNLGEVAEAPYFALALSPGDLGTKGGLLTDPDARVLREDGTAIEGLYACGNVSSAVMGTDYAGPGATLGSAMTFAYVAAHAIARAPATAGVAGA